MNTLGGTAVREQGALYAPPKSSIITSSLCCSWSRIYLCAKDVRFSRPFFIYLFFGFHLLGFGVSVLSLFVYFVRSFVHHLCADKLAVWLDLIVTIQKQVWKITVLFFPFLLVVEQSFGFGFRFVYRKGGKGKRRREL